jgi:hypothetical protein
MATAKTNTKEPVRKLTAHDLAFGIGRKFTNEEISLLIKEHENDTFVDGDSAVKNIIKKLKKNKVAAGKL